MFIVVVTVKGQDAQHFGPFHTYGEANEEAMSMKADGFLEVDDDDGNNTTTYRIVPLWINRSQYQK